MSMEMHVLFRGKLPDRKTLSHAMAELGFPFTIAASVGSLEKQSGFMPMWLRREETGVEFDTYNDRAAVEEVAGKDIDPTFERSANFRWGGDEYEMLAAMCAAAALAKLVNGIVLTEEEDRPFSVDETIALARQHLQTELKPQQARRLNLKRYLKPLLKQRNDLVLIGRLLVIRPVRHVLRGVVFDPISNTHPFSIARFIHLLCADGYFGIREESLSVWEPHFEPLLMDVLATEIFEQVGKITTLDDFAAELPEENWLPLKCAWALLLSGPRERAAAYVEYIESRDPNNPAWKPEYKKLRDLVARDIDNVCAEFHAFEARMVKKLKLEDIWEPSPFPVEIPAAERKHRSDEPLFVTEPWIARPSLLFEEVPAQTGDVRFAINWRRRSDSPILVVPLSRDQAEERHRNGEGYVLAARLSGGLLLLLDRDGESREHPNRAKFPHRDFGAYARLGLFELYGSQFGVQAHFYKDWNADGMIELRNVWVFKRPIRESIWAWSARSEPSKIEQLRCRTPDFGEFDLVVRMVLDLLRSKGHAEIT